MLTLGRVKTSRHLMQKVNLRLKTYNHQVIIGFFCLLIPRHQLMTASICRKMPHHLLMLGAFRLKVKQHQLMSLYAR
jgi:hypothetical protein